MQKAVVLGIFIVLLIPISIANGAEDDGTILRNMNSTIQEALSESKEGDRQEQYGNIGFVGYNHDDHAQDIDMYIDDRGHVETAHNIPPGGYYSSAYLYAETEGWHEVWIEWDDGAHSNHTTYYVVAYETEEVRLDVDYLLDTDNNGFNDPYEQQLANMFCPSFVLHSGDHGVSPEPVQIAFQNQQNQVILWASTHDASGAYDGEAYVDATGYDYSWYDSEEFQENPYACNPSCDVYGNYFLYPHFDYGGAVDCHDEISSYDYDQPSGWYDLYQYGSDWAKPGSDYENTVYAHLFTEGGEYIIQYWFFYPFNDFVNNHEGDWEHINVVITSQNPATAQINRVIYYFHHYYYIAYTTQIENPTTFDCYVIDGTHPIVFVGGHGDAEGCWVSGAGEGSHGSYPIFGTWPTIQPEIDLIFCSIPPIDETVDGNGNWIGYSTIVDDNINDIDGVFIIKGREDYNFQQHPEMSWLGANIIWGYPYVKSMGTENELYDGQNVGNYAPCGPVFNDGWEVVDWNVGEANGQDGFARYYSLPDGYSHVSDAGWAPPEYPVVNQNTGEEFLTIQSAIDDVNTLNGHTIFVHSGVYNEDVLVSKSLTLQGEDKDTTIIHCSGGTGYADAVKITATNVIIRGFTLENSGSGTYAAGIDVRASYATITGNIHWSSVKPTIPP